MSDMESAIGNEFDDDEGGDPGDPFVLEVTFHDVDDKSDDKLWAVWSAVFKALEESGAMANVYVVDPDGNTIREADTA